MAVAPVKEADVIHATSKEVPCIFKVQADVGAAAGGELLVQAETPEMRDTWVEALADARAAWARLPPPADAPPSGGLPFTLSPLADSETHADIKRGACEEVKEEGASTPPRLWVRATNSLPPRSVVLCARGRRARAGHGQWPFFARRATGGAARRRRRPQTRLARRMAAV